MLTQTGCQLFDRFRGGPAVATPVAFSELPSREQILAHLASQTPSVSQLQTDVRVSVDGMPTLRGNLSVEKPDRMRLNAGLLGVSELGIDVGSNSDVFWFWTKVAAPGEEPGIYYASHQQYQQSQLHRSLPIEPSWLIDALGLMSIRPDDRIEGPFQRPDGRLEIRTWRDSGSRRTIRVTTIDPKYGWINQQAYYDGQGNRIAYADSIKHDHYPEHGVSLPGRIEITAYGPNQQPLKLTVDASRFRINSIYGDPQQLWSMPDPSGVRKINLVDAAAEASQLSVIESSQPQSTPGVHVRDHRTSTSRSQLRNNLGSRYLR